MEKALTRMLYALLSIKTDIGKEKELSVLEILKEFFLISDFEWV